MKSNRYNRYRGKSKMSIMNKSEDVIYQPDKLYERVRMRTYDVIMMTEDQFLRISQFPNWGLIKVIDDNDYAYDLAHTIKYYNSDIYNKFKLLFTEWEVQEPRPDEDNEIMKELTKQYHWYNGNW